MAEEKTEPVFDFENKTPAEIGDFMMGNKEFDKKATIAMLNNMIMHSEKYEDKCQCWKDVKEHINKS